eukprot:scaffold115381_cov31-Tisochrysis_lutea.AAC.6
MSDFAPMIRPPRWTALVRVSRRCVARARRLLCVRPTTAMRRSVRGPPRRSTPLGFLDVSPLPPSCAAIS